MGRRISSMWTVKLDRGALRRLLAPPYGLVTLIVLGCLFVAEGPVAVTEVNVTSVGPAPVGVMPHDTPSVSN